ncbi:MAG: phospholipase D-like domain-containing protein, partial [Azovibrio sp.]|uniref:phospholipase D-like domain-containing protein n=1 Tax=Azovibrio sp. TaxID=1872673 RepID=UPI003C729FF0
ANAYLEAIQQARDFILIANAYFLPGLRFRHALRAAVQRGVQVTVMLQGRTDHPLLHFATQALYGALLEEGIRIFEYRKSFLHAKVAVVDGHWATVGSSNIDPFSLLLAKEGNVVVDDPKFAQELQQSLNDALRTGSEELTLAHLGRLPLYSRLLRWCSYGLVRLFIGATGYGPRHWRGDQH